jgi:uncharacterized protein (UPF0248 family)
MAECNDTPTDDGTAPAATACQFFLTGHCHFGKHCTNTHIGEAQPSVKASKPKGKDKGMRPAQDVITRIVWDESVASDQVIVGYEDRFTGVQERAFNDFNWQDDLSTLSHMAVAIPRHRIVYFKYKGALMWCRPDRVDNVFGSTGSGCKLEQFVAEVDEQAPAQTQASDNNDNNDVDDNGADDDNGAYGPATPDNEREDLLVNALERLATNPSNGRVHVASGMHMYHLTAGNG